MQAVDITIRATTGASHITATGITVTAGMLSGDDNDVVRRWNDDEKRWEVVESGEQLPGPSKDDLYYVKTDGDGDNASGGDDGLYKFDGSDWAIDGSNNISLASADPIATEDDLPTTDGWYILDFEKDGHPAGSVWKLVGTTWTFVTKYVVEQKSQLPKDDIAEGTWFKLTKADGANAVGFYKRDDHHAWISQPGATVGDGDVLPTAPTADQLFRLFEHEVTTTARAGVSKSEKVGVAGALAIAILSTHVEALVPAGAVLTLSSTASAITSQSNERDAATATSKAKVGSATGVGASFVQLINGSTVTAEVADGATVNGGAGLAIEAIGFRDMATKAEGGTAGETAVTPVVALVISVDDHVTGRLGTGAAYVGTGAISVKATHTMWVNTEGRADAAGKKTAVGAIVIVNAIVGWQTLAEIARNAQGTSVDVIATSVALTEAKSVASAKGAKSSDDGGKSGDQESTGAVNGDNANTQGTKGQTASMPTSNGGTNGSNGAQGANNSQAGQSGQSGSGGSSTTEVAAAVAVNWLVASSTARITANSVVTATTGALSVISLFTLGANAFAMGSAIDLETNGTRVGAAIGLNVQDADNIAIVGAGAHLTGQTGVTVRAGVPDGVHNDFIVWAFAAGGGKSTSVAGSAAVQITLLTTEASIGAGAEIDAPAGGVAVDAVQPMRLQNLAISGALSTGDGAAIGGAFLVNYLEVNTRAWIDSSALSATKVDASGALAVTATASLDPLVPKVPKPLAGKIDFLKLTNVAVSGAASSGGAAVVGAFIVDIFNLSTRAWIADGALVNQEGTVGGAGQNVTVAASDSITINNVGGALALSKSSAGVGISVVVEISNSDVRAWIGESVAVRAGGFVKVTADSGEDWFVLAVAGAASAGSVAAAGAVLVIVSNEGGSNPQVLAQIGDSLVAATGDVTVHAKKTTKADLASGNLAISTSSAGVGLSVTVVVRNSTVTARIADGADVRAGGDLTVEAIQTGDYLLLAVGGAAGDSAGVGGSVSVFVLSDTTTAQIGSTVKVNCVGVTCANVTVSPTQDVVVTASDTTSALDLAGVLAVGGTAGVGVGVDVQAIDKTTAASIGASATVRANGDVVVQSTSKEDFKSISVGGAVGGTAAVNVNVTVPVIHVTTTASIGANADVRAGGNVLVMADDGMTLFSIAGNISVAGTAAVGASVAVPVVTKTTSATIGAGARVSGLALIGHISHATVNAGSYATSGHRHPVRPARNPGRLADALPGSEQPVRRPRPSGRRGDDQPRIHARLQGRPAGHLRRRRGAPITGLTDGATYYVIPFSATAIRLCLKRGPPVSPGSERVHLRPRLRSHRAHSAGRREDG